MPTDFLIVIGFLRVLGEGVTFSSISQIVLLQLLSSGLFQNVHFQCSDPKGSVPVVCYKIISSSAPFQNVPFSPDAYPACSRLLKLMHIQMLTSCLKLASKMGA